MVGRRRHLSAGSAAARPGDRVQLAQVPSAVQALERDLAAALFDRDRHPGRADRHGPGAAAKARKRSEPRSVQRAAGAVAG